MPVELFRSPQAQRDLLDIYVVIGLDDPLAAERVYDRIETRTKELLDHPRLGPRCRDISPSARVLVEGPYLILYETHPDMDDGPVARDGNRGSMRRCER
ncbi:type II toxin-antitoxin system RelE/ParE family toxin [Telmatospirillum siberiense]|uniref:Type II toxin-antitoxin system RelE/ParE family toxin n=1 Tax=Telmatospirillum siberiense TaxID=382514 RepID=A0A2N3PXL1_9PROT|nr:type II toxin-antitoxin system RelE/ParE family toxin [Telmatospirillum siberiense]PKU25127.1 type II toxin-antitoxin system RelE/ParE family toxin [Telmatospirillum siberiense]